MSKYILLVLIYFLFSCNSAIQNKIRYDIAYISNDSICVYNLSSHDKMCFPDTTCPSFPAISPDGYKLAYTMCRDTTINSQTESLRYIVIVDLDTKKMSRLKIPSNNYYAPSWSPDGNWIAFSIIDSLRWQAGIINIENNDFKIIKSKSNIGFINYITWTNDSKNIITTINEIYDLYGNVIETIDLQKILDKKLEIIATDKCQYTSNKETIVFNSGVSEESKDINRDDGDTGPNFAIFSYNFKTKKLIRLSPKRVYASEFNIVNDNLVVYSASRNIYLTDINGNNLRLIIKNGFYPSMSITN